MDRVKHSRMRPDDVFTKSDVFIYIKSLAENEVMKHLCRIEIIINR